MMQVMEAKEFLGLAETTHKVHPQSTLAEVLTQQALFRCFVLSYSKCFTAIGKGRASLDAAKVFKTVPNCLPTHERILLFRHKFAAHGDDSGLEEAVIAVREDVDHFMIQHLYSVANPLNEYAEFREALDILESYVVDGLNKNLDHLQRKLGKPVFVHGADDVATGQPAESG